MALKVGKKSLKFAKACERKIFSPNWNVVEKERILSPKDKEQVKKHFQSLPAADDPDWLWDTNKSLILFAVYWEMAGTDWLWKGSLWAELRMKHER